MCMTRLLLCVILAFPLDNLPPRVLFFTCSLIVRVLAIKFDKRCIIPAERLLVQQQRYNEDGKGYDTT